MNFFGAQDTSRKQTVVLLALYAAVIVLTVLAIYFSILFIFRNDDLWCPRLLGWVTAIAATLILGGTIWKLISLGSTGESIAEELGGEIVDIQDHTPQEHVLLNIVEEMAIAASIPAPKTFILRDESGINAFAAGLSRESAVIAVTEGSMENLTRDELQGVVAHECGHIVNGDMRLNLLTIGLQHGILLIAITGKKIFQLSRGILASEYRAFADAGTLTRRFLLVIVLALPVMLVSIFITIIGYISRFIGKLLNLAISRQREYLADACAVQFARNSSGISSALKKIGNLENDPSIQNVNAEKCNHLFFANSITGVLSDLLSTHPPLEERIRRIDGSSQSRVVPHLKKPLATVDISPVCATDAKVESIQWHYAADGQDQGPVEYHELVAIARSGKLKPSDLVWNSTMGEQWQEARSLTHLFLTIPSAITADTTGISGKKSRMETVKQTLIIILITGIVIGKLWQMLK